MNDISQPELVLDKKDKIVIRTKVPIFKEINPDIKDY